MSLAQLDAHREERFDSAESGGEADAPQQLLETRVGA
jgi:hypothetical protein